MPDLNLLITLNVLLEEGSVARTSSGSPVVSRNRASARLIADGLSRSRAAARATLPSASSTSSVASRLRSGRGIDRP